MYRPLACAALAVALLGSAYLDRAAPEERAPAGFLSTTIDVGVVVTNVEKSAAFYTEAIGMTEVPGFDVDGELLGNVGLTDELPASIRVFVLGEGVAATKIKLMAFPKAEPKTAAGEFVHSQLGLSYLTIVVDDMGAAVERLAAAGTKPIANGPVSLGEAFGGFYLALVRDPDGNLVELVGPKK
jgi:lactoylglutathione lyase